MHVRYCACMKSVPYLCNMYKHLKSAGLRTRGAGFSCLPSSISIGSSTFSTFIWLARTAASWWDWCAEWATWRAAVAGRPGRPGRPGVTGRLRAAPRGRPPRTPGTPGGDRPAPAAPGAAAAQISPVPCRPDGRVIVIHRKGAATARPPYRQ